MDNHHSLDPEFQAWFRERPMVIQDMVLTTPPWETYAMNGDGDRYQVYSYNENGTVTVTRFHPGPLVLLPMWNVFGVDPANLTPVEGR